MRLSHEPGVDGGPSQKLEKEHSYVPDFLPTGFDLVKTQTPTPAGPHCGCQAKIPRKREGHGQRFFDILLEDETVDPTEEVTESFKDI